MKYLLHVFLCLGLLCALVGCKSDETKEVEKLISAIGEVTLDSGNLLENAEKAYANLSKEDAEDVQNYEKLLKMRETFNQLEKDDEATQLAKKIDEAINKIGEVTLKKEKLINSTKKLYEDAPYIAIEKVHYSFELECAINKLAALKFEERVKKLGQFSPDKIDKIQELIDDYYNLEYEVKQYIENREKIINKYEKYIKDYLVNQSNTVLKKFRARRDKINDITYYYSSAYPEYCNIRSYVLPYLGVHDDGYPYLCLKYNYTGDNWIFIDEIIIATDYNKFNKQFSFFDITRDNDTDVWEYYNTADLSDVDIEMLREMAESSKVIVRFEGKDYYTDYELSYDDKVAIQQILDAYDTLKEAYNYNP